MTKRVICALAFVCVTTLCCTSCSDQKQDAWQLVWEENFDGDTFDSSCWSKIQRGKSETPQARGRLSGFFRSTGRNGRTVAKSISWSDSMMKISPIRLSIHTIRTYSRKKIRHKEQPAPFAPTISIRTPSNCIPTAFRSISITVIRLPIPASKRINRDSFRSTASFTCCSICSWADDG